MDRWWFWLILIIGIPYVGGPIMIKLVQKMQARPEFQALNPGELPEDVWVYLRQNVEALARLGFTATAYLNLPNAMPNVNTYLVMLVNPETLDKAMVTAMFALQGETWKLGTRYLEFSTRYADGRSIDTMNSAQLGSFRAAPEETKTQVPSVQDPAELYRLHQHVMSRVAPGAEKVLYPEKDASSYLARVMVESFDQQVKFGILSYNAAEGVYVPTWKGAFLMTWGLLWPVVAFRNARLKQKERAVLTSFRSAQAASGWSPAAS